MKKLLVLVLMLCMLIGMVVAADAADLSGCTLNLPSSLKSGEEITLVVTGNNISNIDHMNVNVYKGYTASGTPVYTATSNGFSHTIPADTLPPSTYSYQTYYFSVQLYAADGSTATVGKSGNVSRSYTSEKPSIKLTATPAVGQPLSVSWTAVEHMDVYTVKVAYDSLADYSGITHQSEQLTGTSYTIPGTAFPTDDRYEITVTGMNSGGFWSNVSNYVDVSTGVPPLSVNVPSSLPVGSALTIRWEHPDQSSHTLYMDLKGPNGSSILYGELPASPASYTVAEGILRKSGTYKLKFYCKTCGSLYTELNTTFTMTGADLPDPTIEMKLAESMTLGDTLRLRWTPVPGATKYTVYINNSTYTISGTFEDGYLSASIPYSLEGAYNRLKVGQNKIKIKVSEGLFKVTSPEYILQVTDAPALSWVEVPEVHPQLEGMNVSWTLYPGTEEYRFYLTETREDAEQMKNLTSLGTAKGTATSCTLSGEKLTEVGEHYLMIAAYDSDLYGDLLSKAIISFRIEGPDIEIIDYTPFFGADQFASCTIKTYPNATHYSISSDGDWPYGAFVAAEDGAKQTLHTDDTGTLYVSAWYNYSLLQQTTIKVASQSKVPDIVVLSPGEKYDMWPHAKKMKIYNIINSDIDWRMNTNSSAVELTYKGYIIARKPGKAIIHLDNWFHDSLDVTVYVGTKLKSLKINGPDALAASKSTTLKVSYTPSNATYKNVNWKIVSGGNAATISKSGKLTAKKVTKPTKVVVVAYTTDVSCINNYHVVTVMPGATAVNVFDENGEKLNGKTITIDMNNGIPTGTESVLTFQASAQVLPAACMQEVTWKTSNKKVAKVSAAGKVTAVGDGTATITATAKDGSGKKVTFKVKVVHKPYGLSISGAEAVTVGQTITLTGKVTPTNATNKKVKWASSDEAIATVDTAGVVTGVAEGTVTITGTAAGNSSITAEYTVTVLPKATYVDILDENGASVRGQTIVLDLNTKQRATLTAALLPENAAQAVTWKTADKKIAKVSSSGVVTPVAEGTVTITATAKDGSGKKATVTIKVTRLATGVTLTGSQKIAVGQTIALKAVATDATLQKFAWTSDNTDVVIVTSAGKITGVAEGTATITATTKDGTNLSASLTVTVVPAAQTIEILDPDGNVKNGKTIKLDLSKKQKIKLTARILPEEALDGVTWKSSNPKIAKVSKTGLITPVATGKVTITVTAKDGSGVIAKIIIKVVK